MSLAKLLTPKEVVINVQKFPATSSKGIISNTKELFWIFNRISEISIKFRILEDFEKKDEPPCLIISEIIDCYPIYPSI